MHQKLLPLFHFGLRHLTLWVSLGLLTLLLLRDPFSQRTLIPNFEPFPDSFHYITPVRCWLAGQGFKLCRANENQNVAVGVKPSVPPLYSLSLVPFLAINDDPRFFYLANVVMSLAALVVLYVITHRITRNQLIKFICCLVYVTAYHTWWFPSLAMAETLLMLLFLLAIWLSFQPFNYKTMLAGGLLAASFYATKYAALPMTLGYAGLLGLAVLLTKQTAQHKMKLVTTLCGAFLLAFIAFGGLATMQSIITLANSIIAPAPTQVTTDSTSTQESVWFSSQFVTNHSLFYLKAALGQPTTVLWDVRPLLPMWAAVAGWLGLVTAVINRRHRFPALILWTMVLAQVAFMAFFYTADSRYILHLLPTLVIGLAFYLTSMVRLFRSQGRSYVFYGITCLVLTLFLISQFQPIKAQVGLNLKYAETPWWYMSVNELNRFFATKSESEQYVIALASPFLVDFYGNGNYQVLPLSAQQDFHGNRLAVWGEPQEPELLDLYQQKLDQDHPVYVTNYGINATELFRAEFAAIEQNFTLTQVQEGCFNLCNIYRLETKSAAQ